MLNDHRSISLQKQKQSREQNFDADLQNKEIPLLKQSQHQSEFIAEYTSYFAEIQSPTPEEIKHILSSEANIQWTEEWVGNLTQQILQTNFQSMTVELRLGNFVMQIDVLNCIIPFDIEQQYIVGKGTFGSIYQVIVDKKKVAVKALKIKQSRLSSNFLSEIYQQYFILKIASVLKIGPKLINAFRYDVVVLENKVLICMQNCINKFINRNDFLKYEVLIKKDLKILHTINICHCDIKNQNLMWSLELQKYVFIDFGLSRILKQRPGTKIQTSFVGTFRFCSPQMKKLIYKNASCFIDFYYNDVHSLSKCLALHIDNQFLTIDENDSIYQSQNCYTQITIMEKEFKSQFTLSCMFSIFRLKYSIYKCNATQITNIIKKQRRMLKTFLQLICQLKEVDGLLQVVASFEEEIKNQLVKNRFVTCEMDDIMFKYQVQINTSEHSYLLIPFTLILELDDHKFNQLLLNDNWMIRFFKILDPSNILVEQPKHVIHNKKRLIQKIYLSLQNNTQPDIYFFNKVRKVLLLFFSRFKKLRLYPEIDSIHMILMRMQAFSDALQIEHEMLQQQNNICKKMLRKMDYFLGWQCRVCACKPNRQIQYLTQIEQKYVAGQNKIIFTETQIQIVKVLLQIKNQFINIIRTFQNKSRVYDQYVELTKYVQESTEVILQQNFWAIELKILKIFNTFLDEYKTSSNMKQSNDTKNYLLKRINQVQEKCKTKYLNSNNILFPQINIVIYEAFNKNQQQQNIQYLLKWVFETYRKKQHLLGVCLIKILRKCAVYDFRLTYFIIHNYINQYETILVYSEKQINFNLAFLYQLRLLLLNFQMKEQKKIISAKIQQQKLEQTNQKWLRECQQSLEQFLERISQSSKILEDQRLYNISILFKQINQLIKAYIECENRKFSNAISIILEALKKQLKDNEPMKMNFIHLIVRLKRQCSEHQALIESALDTALLQGIGYVNMTSVFIFSYEVLHMIIHIKCSRKLYVGAYATLIDVIQHISHYLQQSQSRSNVLSINLMQSIFIFCEMAPLGIIVRCIQQEIKNDTLVMKKLLPKPQLMTLLFCCLHIVNEIIPSKLSQRILTLTAFCFGKFSQYSTSKIKQRYYSLYGKVFTNLNYRKQLIISKQDLKHKAFPSIKNFLKLIQKKAEYCLPVQRQQTYSMIKLKLNNFTYQF